MSVPVPLPPNDKSVIHDTTLTGDGTQANPLSVIGGGGGGLTVVTHDSTLSGNGTIANPLTVIGNPSMVTGPASAYYTTGGGLTVAEIPVYADTTGKLIGNGLMTQNIDNNSHTNSYNISRNGKFIQIAVSDTYDKGLIVAIASNLEIMVNGNIVLVFDENGNANFQQGVQLSDFNGINAPAEGQIGYDFTNHQAMIYDGSNWINIIGSVALGDSFQGDGSIANPLEINVQHDTSLSGDGTTANPLTVVGGGLGILTLLFNDLPCSASSSIIFDTSTQPFPAGNYLCILTFMLDITTVPPNLSINPQIDGATIVEGGQPVRFYYQPLNVNMFYTATFHCSTPGTISFNVRVTSVTPISFYIRAITLNLLPV